MIRFRDTFKIFFFGTKNVFYLILGTIRILLKKTALSLLCVSQTLTSSKKLEKTNKQILRKRCHRRMGRRKKLISQYPSAEPGIQKKFLYVIQVGQKLSLTIKQVSRSLLYYVTNGSTKNVVQEVRLLFYESILFKQAQPE